MKVSDSESLSKLINPEIVLDHIHYFKRNLNPLNKKGDEYKKLHYDLHDYEILSSLFDHLISNTSFKGELIVESNVYDDNIGYKISKIIWNNKIRSLKIGNKNKPFSDRVAKEIGEALEHNTNLTSLEVFLDVEELSNKSLCKFLRYPESSLQSLSFLKINKELFEFLSDNLNKQTKLDSLKFYYEPLRSIDLYYKPLIDKEAYFKLADKIQNDSNIYSIDLIPLYTDYDSKINQVLDDDIAVISETLKFACEMNYVNSSTKIEIDKAFNKENQRKNLILQNLNLILDNSTKNSIVSVRSYLQKTIGELLNNALYELEIRRERYSDDEELFTAKGSIRFIANFLINQNN